MAGLPSESGGRVVNQVHAGKLATDITASVVSTVLLWRGHTRTGLLVRYLAPPAGSVLVLARADLAALAATRRGRYVSVHMPPSSEIVRLTGDVIMTLGAVHRRPTLLVFGVVVVVAGWSRPLLVRTVAAVRAATHSMPRYPHMEPCQ